MNIVVLDGFALNPGDLDWTELESLGTVTIYDRTSDDEILSRIRKADIVLTNKTPLTSEILYQCPSLKMISVLATGYDIIDLMACNELGIVVCNVPDYGTKSVSQMTMALLLEVCNQVGYHAQRVKQGQWIHSKDWCFWDIPLIELDQKTMGIIGYGRIGQNTAKLAKAFGMNVLALGHKNFREDVPYVDMKTLCQQSDVIVLHCSLTAETYHLINEQTLSWMKPGSILINNARGDLVDETALANALNTNHIYAAALDVVSKEPMEKNNPLLKAKNCFITPHMSWASLEARQRILNTTIENIRGFLNSKPIHRIKMNQ